MSGLIGNSERALRASADMSHDIGIIQTSRFVASSRNRLIGFTTSQLNRRVVELP